MFGRRLFEGTSRQTEWQTQCDDHSPALIAISSTTHHALHCTRYTSSFPVTDTDPEGSRTGNTNEAEHCQRNEMQSIHLLTPKPFFILYQCAVLELQSQTSCGHDCVAAGRGLEGGGGGRTWRGVGPTSVQPPFDSGAVRACPPAPVARGISGAPSSASAVRARYKYGRVCARKGRSGLAKALAILPPSPQCSPGDVRETS